MNDSSLEQLREQLDEVNHQLVKVLAERFQLTDQVAEYKKANGLPVVDLAREEKQIERIGQIAKDVDLDPVIAQKVLRLIIDEVRERHRAAGVK